MSGKRAKRLRAEFVKQFGRFPKRTRTSKGHLQKNNVTQGVPIAATHKVETEEKINGIIRKVTRTRRILRAIFEVTVTAPSEWRRWKRAMGDRHAFDELFEPTVLHPKRGVVLAKRMPERLAA
jgi:hypothetical protein